jgi:DNA-binding transcriptional regulator YiaG
MIRIAAQDAGISKKEYRKLNISCDTEIFMKNKTKDGHPNPLTPENFPAEIRRLRRQNNWSVKNLADRLGVSPRTVENWEQGRRTPTSLTLVNLFLEDKGN